MTNAPTLTEKSKKQCDNIKKRHQKLRLHNDCGLIYLQHRKYTHGAPGAGPPEKATFFELILLLIIICKLIHDTY